MNLEIYDNARLKKHDAFKKGVYRKGGHSRRYLTFKN